MLFTRWTTHTNACVIIVKGNVDSFVRKEALVDESMVTFIEYYLMQFKYSNIV